MFFNENIDLSNRPTGSAFPEFTRLNPAHFKIQTPYQLPALGRVLLLTRYWFASVSTGQVIPAPLARNPVTCQARKSCFCPCGKTWLHVRECSAGMDVSFIVYNVSHACRNIFFGSGSDRNHAGAPQCLVLSRSTYPKVAETAQHPSEFCYLSGRL